MLRDCISLDELRKELSCPPRDLNEVCERILLSIPTFRRQAAIRIVQLLLYSSRPLKVSELLDAIAVDTEGDTPFDKSRRPIEAMVIAVYCSSLTVLVRDEEVPQSLTEARYRRSNNSEPVLQLAHFSVTEYLKSANIKISFCDDLQEQMAEQTFSEVCVTCLLRIKENNTAELIRHQFPFAQYCSENWYIYSAMPRTEPNRLHTRIMELLNWNEVSFANSICLHPMDRRGRLKGASHGLAPPLYYASFSGLSIEVGALLDQGANVNAEGGEYGNALQAASFEGHNEIVEMLLASGAIFEE